MDRPGKTGQLIPIYNARTGRTEEVTPLIKTDDEWKAQLTSEQFQVARKQGTEYAFTGKYHASKEHGIYSCICCGTNLFLSDTKFDSVPVGLVFSRRFRHSTSALIPILREG